MADNGSFYATHLTLEAAEAYALANTFPGQRMMITPTTVLTFEVED